MKRVVNVCMAVFLLLATGLLPANSSAQQFTDVYIREVKVTGSELVVVEAIHDIVDLSVYWLSYASSDTATNIVPIQQFPKISLLAGQAILFTNDGAATCDATYTTKLSPGLADTKGTVELRKLESAGLQSTFTTVDSVNWSKPAASATVTAKLDLRKEVASMVSPLWYQNANAQWQLGDLSGCALTLMSSNNPSGPLVIEWTQAAVEPFAIIESVTDDQEVDTSGAEVTINKNVGLAPPQITEMLPNPPGTGTDDSQEFIELYNSNDVPFDLSGFKLVSGTSTTHTYVFPAGTVLGAKSFSAYFSDQTKLTLSNTGSKVVLLDPLSVQISATNEYGSAKDGMAWALAQGEWYWTNRPTPGGTNIIVQVEPSQLATTTSKSVLGTTKKAVTPKTSTKKATTKKAATKKTAKPVSQVASIDSEATKPTGIHPGILALVAVAAVGYGIYGYRHDIANKIHNFRANRASGRNAGK